MDSTVLTFSIAANHVTKMADLNVKMTTLHSKKVIGGNGRMKATDYFMNNLLTILRMNLFVLHSAPILPGIISPSLSTLSLFHGHTNVHRMKPVLEV